MNRLVVTLASLLPLAAAACTSADDPSTDPAALACGSAAVATIATARGTTVELCVHDGGVEVIAEARPSGSVATVGTLGLDAADHCALDVYLALAAPDAPVPAALVDSCALRSTRDRAAALAGREIIDDVVLAPAATATATSLAAYTVGFCGTTGSTNFIDYVCPQYVCGSGQDCAYWCGATLKPISQRTMTAVLGNEGNMSRQEIVSCTGTTRFRGFSAWDKGDPFSTLVDASVPNGWTYWIEMDYIGGIEDKDFRFRAEPAAGSPNAQHRETGAFIDL